MVKNMTLFAVFFSLLFLVGGKETVEAESITLESIEIKDSTPIVYVDGVKGFEDPKPVCLEHYSNGYIQSCTDKMSSNGNINGFCSCDGSGDGLRIAKFSYDYNGKHAERYRFYYYVVKTDIGYNIDGTEKVLHVVDDEKVAENYSVSCKKFFYDGKMVDCYNTEVDVVDVFVNEQWIGYAGYSALFPDTGDVKAHLLVQPLEFDKTGLRQKVKVSYGENYHWSSDTVTLIYSPEQCKDIKVVKMGCPIPNNWRFPPNENKSPDRHTEFSIRFNVVGMSSGSGE